jgi:sialic acid synthase SpsE
MPGKALDAKGNPDWSKSDVDGGASIVTEEMQAMLYWAKQAFLKRSGQKISPEANTELELISRKAAYGYGTKAIGPSKAEIDTNEAGATRFIYAVRDLPAGHALELEDLHFSRAIHHKNPAWSRNTPLPTSTLRQVLGNRTLAALEKGDPIFAENLKEKIDLKKPYEPGLFQLKAEVAV